MYIRNGPTPSRPASPWRRESSPGIALRAATRLSNDDTDAVSVNMPSKPAGSPSICRSQSTTTCSSSVDAGAFFQNITFELRPAASHSPRMPGPEATLGK